MQTITSNQIRDSLKDHAIELRKSGLSYNDLSAKLGIPKSTLSYWFKGIRESHLITKLNSNAAHIVSAKNIIKYNKDRSVRHAHMRDVRRDHAAAEIEEMDAAELRIVGAALYWAEGYKKSKWSSIFCNTDPLMVRIMMRFFREICHVAEDKFKPQVHVHNLTQIGLATSYWAKIIGIDEARFRKPLLQTSRASKKKVGHTLPYGTFRIRIDDVRLVSNIEGWIKGICRASHIGA